MALEKLDLGSLERLDQGRIAVAFEHALRRAEMDCKDRPGVKAARTVVLVARIMPLQDVDTGQLDTCNVDFQVHESIPKRRSRTYSMRASPGGLVFNELSPDNIKQGTLDEPIAPKAVAAL